MLLGESDASNGTRVAFVGDIHGAVFDRDGSRGEGIVGLEIGNGCKAKDGSAGGVDGELSMIAGQPIDSVHEVRTGAELQDVVGFLGWHAIAEDGNLTAGSGLPGASVFPMAPGQLAVRSIEQHDAENGAEFAVGDEAGELILLMMFGFLCGR